MLKNLLISTGLTLCSFLGFSQTINFSNGKVTYSFPAEIAGEMTFEGETVTVAGRQFNLPEWTNMKVNDDVYASNTVNIQYSPSAASVIVAGNIAQYIDVAVNGAHVSVTQSETVGDNTCGEITYILKGDAADGSFTLTGSYKATLELQGLALTNPSGAALNIQNGKRISLSAKSGTVNTLTDGNGSQKGAIDCKGHLELKGKGELNVKGNKSHAIYAKEYVEVKNLNLNISGATKDGINCSQYFLMESGTIIINNTGDDAIQTSYKDDANREQEDTGTITIKGGTITATISADAAKCIKADGNVVISGGKLDLTSN